MLRYRYICPSCTIYLYAGWNGKFPVTWHFPELREEAMRHTGCEGMFRSKNLCLHRNFWPLGALEWKRVPDRDRTADTIRPTGNYSSNSSLRSENSSTTSRFMQAACRNSLEVALPLHNQFGSLKPLKGDLARVISKNSQTHLVKAAPWRRKPVSGECERCWKYWSRLTEKKLLVEPLRTAATVFSSRILQHQCF